MDTIERLYGAFARADGDAMAACYAPDARFSDPVFGELRGGEVGDMWRMLTGRAKDLVVDLHEHDATSAHWTADYTFRTGRKVHNDIQATFRIGADGLIAEHDDRFSFHAWSRQALGPVGLLLGWTPFLRAKVSKEARAGLEDFRRPGAAPA